MISAILSQEGQPVQRMQDRQTANTNRLTALQALQTNMNALSSSLSTLGGTSFNARTVASTDSNGTYVSATATGAQAGSYDLLVSRVATKGRISPTLSYQGTSSNPSVLTFGSATAKTTIGAVGFSIDSFVSGGAVSGTFTVGGTNYTLTGTNGTLAGAAGTPLEGLTVSVSGTGTGTLNLAGGVPGNLAVADPLATPIFSGSSASFAIQGTDGVIKTLTLSGTNNTLYGLRDAINALGTADPAVPNSKGLGVVASVVNTGNGANPYQLVLTAKDTGTGTTGGLVRIADVTSGGAVNSLGIAAGTVDSLTAPTTLGGGLTSTGTDAAQDALFTVNGIQLSRKTNAVSDVVDGVTFNLKQGGQTTPTTLTVALDKGTITSALQDVVTKFNALVTSYKNASAAGGALVNDSPTRSFISQIRAALAGSPAGLGAGATFTSAADLGLKTNRDGTLSLDTAALSTALDKDPDAAKRIFANSGASTNAAVSLYAFGTKTATGAVAFNITSFTSGGAVSGTFTVGGNTYTLSGTNGNLAGVAGTPLEGLILTVKGTGSGTLTLSRGVGQAAQDTISGLTAYGTGSLSRIMSAVKDQNFNLSRQISDGQARLDRRKTILQAQFAQVESMVSQLQSAGQSLSGLR
jgi:flagellar hook-associated protein 2